jgi:hypothetical protein
LSLGSTIPAAFSAIKFNNSLSGERRRKTDFPTRSSTDCGSWRLKGSNQREGFKHSAPWRESVGWIPRCLPRAWRIPHPAVRRHALRLSEPWLDQQNDLRKIVLERIDDSAYEVRLQAAYTLGESKDPEAARAIADLQLRDGRDPYLSAALRSSVNGDNIVLILETLRDRDWIWSRPGRFSLPILRWRSD